MNAIALALVFFAAVLHASWNFVSKKSGGGSSFVLLYETFALFDLHAAALFGGFQKAPVSSF